MKNKKTPMRRCIGCMESKPKEELIRVACYEGRLTVDPTGRAKGRGVYLCRNHDCMSKARKRRALQRSLQAEFTEDAIERIFSLLEEYPEEYPEECPGKNPEECLEEHEK